MKLETLGKMTSESFDLNGRLNDCENHSDLVEDLIKSLQGKNAKLEEIVKRRDCRIRLLQGTVNRQKEMYEGKIKVNLQTTCYYQ